MKNTTAVSSLPIQNENQSKYESKYDGMYIFDEKGAEPIGYLKTLKIARLLDEIYADIVLRNVIQIAAGTGSGKTVGVPRLLLHKIQTGEYFVDSKILVSIPTVINVKSQFEFACVNNPSILHEFAKVCGGARSQYANTARLTYATTQSVVNMLLALYEKKDFTALNNLIVVIDEAHHSSQENYILHGLVNWLLEQGHTMKVIIMTATPAEHPFKRLHVTEPIELKMTANPIEVHWAESSTVVYDKITGDTRIIGSVYDAVMGRVDEAIKILDAEKAVEDKKTETKTETKTESEPPHILIFVAGEKDVLYLCNSLSKRYPECNVLPLYTNLPQEEQDAVSLASTKRKIIVTTNVAESGVTIPNVMAVIDTMLCKKMTRDVSGASTLSECAIPQSSSMQRRGRAARQAKYCVGHYLPLVTEADFENLLKDYESEFMSLPKHIPVITLLSKGLPAKDVLMIPHEEYAKLASELIKMDVIQRVGDKHVPTPLGNQVAKYPLTIENTCSMLRAIKRYNVTKIDFDRRHDNFVELLQFVLGITVIETAIACPNVFEVPPEYRRNRNDFFKSGALDRFIQDTDITVLISIFCEMMSECYNQHTGKTEYRSWCKKNHVSTKFMDSAFRLFNQLWYIVMEVAGKSKNVMYQRDFVEVLGRMETNKTSMYVILAKVYSDRQFEAHRTHRGVNYESINSCRIVQGSLDNKSIARLRESPPEHIIALYKTTIAVPGKRPFTVLALAFPLPPQNPASQPVSLSEEVKIQDQPETLSETSSPVTLTQQPVTEPEQIVFDTGLEHVGFERVRIEFRRNGVITDPHTGIAVDRIRQLAKKTHSEVLARAFVMNCMIKITNNNQIFHLKNMLRYLDEQRIISYDVLDNVVNTELRELAKIAERHNSQAIIVFHMLRDYCA